MKESPLGLSGLIRSQWRVHLDWNIDGVMAARCDDSSANGGCKPTAVDPRLPIDAKSDPDSDFGG